MTFLEFCRNRAFWLMDTLKGGGVRNSLELLDNCEGGIWSDAEIEKYQCEKVAELLSHCRRTVPFYKSQTAEKLIEWPVVNKTTFKEGYGQFLSSNYKKEDLIQMSTSGSTGTPFISYQNTVKKRHVNAEVIYYNGQLGYQIGRRIIYLRSVVSEISKSTLSQFAQNIYLLNCTDLSDNGIEAKLDFIRKYSFGCGALMIGYSSTFDAFRKYFERYGYQNAKGCNLYGIVGSSTMLFDNTREAMEKAFNCRCYSRYANEENGFIGQDGVENNHFFVNRANYFVEILKFDSDVPADTGEIGRIVVTDLYNYAMPMVRYDTGDVGAWIEIEKDGKKCKVIGSFGGRVIDMIYNCYGDAVSPHSISTAMWKFQDIEQYQFAQLGKGEYEIRISIHNASSFVNEKELIEALKVVLGQEGHIVIKYCSEIPVLLSGKRRYIVNEMRI